MRSRRRDMQVFSLSFLDCICCAFGAIILLFVLSKFAEPVVIEELQADGQVRLSQLEEELTALQGAMLGLNDQLAEKKQRLAGEQARIIRLQGDLSRIEGQFASSQGDAAVQNIIEGRLARVRQELTVEMKRLLQQAGRVIPRGVGGIPVDSEYIIFIIDTSGSMQRYAWALVQRKMRETLKVYPRVKGIQIMNDMGTYMFPEYRGRWIPDTPARRRIIISRLLTWRPFSNSSPVEGITEAIRTYSGKTHHISLYIFGDEFSGPAIQPVIDEVDRLNRVGRDGSRRVRIHGVGFPVVMEHTDQDGNTGERFASLMRTLCHRNGGTFVGLNTTVP